ncbi:hypothetical protein [Brasilonema sp. UFV-L1]|uniref:hypothetical protein n=1 Tax=Brasilonema sp. UFV-L1 TaxID=2234130 RepID=UPI00145DAB44|nr:hypothetical protein [Brasilonema sp. UFV-L1]NMG09196.1 hypothetical protein [Brasilonema sp. UFV-L1]
MAFYAKQQYFLQFFTFRVKAWEAMDAGVEAIIAIGKRWTTDRRWCAVLVLEQIAADDLRRLEEFPQFYQG